MYVKFKECIGGRLRGLCDRLTPRQRAIAVIVMVSLFALVNFYMIFSDGRMPGRTSSG